MGRIITGDPTTTELRQPPESSHEADVHFYTPSKRYREIAEFVDKDLVLAHLGKIERREVILIIRILLNAVKLEDTKEWKHSDGKENRDLSTYWMQRLVATAVTSRAIDGEAARLSKTRIADERLRHDQTLTTPKASPLDMLKPRG